jgi:hypothetical protein
MEDPSSELSEYYDSFKGERKRPSLLTKFIIPMKSTAMVDPKSFSVIKKRDRRISSSLGDGIILANIDSVFNLTKRSHNTLTDVPNLLFDNQSGTVKYFGYISGRKAAFLRYIKYRYPFPLSSTFCLSDEVLPDFIEPKPNISFFQGKDNNRIEDNLDPYVLHVRRMATLGVNYALGDEKRNEALIPMIIALVMINAPGGRLVCHLPNLDPLTQLMIYLVGQCYYDILIFSPFATLHTERYLIGWQRREEREIEEVVKKMLGIWRKISDKPDFPEMLSLPVEEKIPSDFLGKLEEFENWFREVDKEKKKYNIYRTYLLWNIPSEPTILYL